MSPTTPSQSRRTSYRSGSISNSRNGPSNIASNPNVSPHSRPLHSSGQATPTTSNFANHGLYIGSNPTTPRQTFSLGKGKGVLKGSDDEDKENILGGSSTAANVADSDDDQNQDDEEEAEGAEEADFKSHYSRRSSSASSTSDADEGDTPNDAPMFSNNMNNHSANHNLHRVTSLPIPPPNKSTRPAVAGLHSSQSTTSLPPLLPPPPPPHLFPPFYNRPPTPLPPSPSLTSLLRPPSLLNRSTTSTRPTTPDSSDVETPNDTEAAVAQSARRAQPLPPSAPKVPTYEYYGFTLYLASSLSFLMYLLWSYLPSPFLHALGITYYPNRWWSLAIPAWIVMALIFIYVALLSFNVEYLTLPMVSLGCMVDDAGNVAILDVMNASSTGGTSYGQQDRRILRVRKGGSKRYVTEMEMRKKLDITDGKGNAKNRRRAGSGGTGSAHGSRRSKRSPNKRKKGQHQQYYEDIYDGREYSNHKARSRSRHNNNYTSSNSAASTSNSFPNTNYASSTYYTEASGFSDETSESESEDWFGVLGANINTSNGSGGNGYGSKVDVPSWRHIWNEGTDAVMDIPIGGVCEVLYSGD